MKKIIKEILMKDIGWKILSVIIAICLWFVVINIQNPVENRTINVPVEFRNKDVLISNGLVLVNEKDFTNLKVSVKIRGQRISLDRLNSKNIEAYVDLTKVTDNGGKEVSAPITVSLPGIVGDSCQILSRDPQYVSIVVDNVITKEKTVKANVVGQTAGGFIMAKLVLDPAVIKISGAESDINKVENVVVDVSLDNAVKDMTLKAVPVAYDANGEIVSGVFLSEKEISAIITVSKSKQVPVKVMTQGLPAFNYKVVETTWSPEYIEVVGEEEALKSITEITLPVVNIQNKTATVEEEYSVKKLLPEGLGVKEGTTASVKVKVEIAQEITKAFHIPGSQLRTEGTLPENLKATFKPVDVELTLSGLQDAIDAVDTTKILGTIDITNLKAGEQTVVIQFTLPEGVTVHGTAPVALVTITDDSLPLPEQETSTESEPEMETIEEP